MSAEPARSVRFPLGRTVITRGALDALDEADVRAAGIARHASGDWGDLCPKTSRRTTTPCESAPECYPPITPTVVRSSGSSPRPTDRPQPSCFPRSTDVKTIKRVRLKQVCDGRIRFSVERKSRVRETSTTPCCPLLPGADREILSVLCLDAQNQPNCFNVASIGALNTTRTRPADILKAAILSNALGLVLIHNHPSGELEPSPEDLEFTAPCSGPAS